MADIDTESENAAAELGAKDQVRRMLDNLPDDVTLEDIQYHLYVVQKITRAEERAEMEGWISNDEARRRLSKWLDE